MHSDATKTCELHLAAKLGHNKSSNLFSRSPSDKALLPVGKPLERIWNT
jgi:hypothetical protein